MTLSESLSVALFTMVVVMGVLAILFFLIKIFSFAVGKFEKSFSSQKVQATSPTVNEVLVEEEIEEEVFSSGTLKLTNVDESTAAMIMAIVSDESGIPLSQLCFKSIRLISE